MSSHEQRYPALRLAMRRPKRSCEIVTALCRLTAQRPFIPSSTSRITSEGTPRIVDEIGATVTVDRWLTALSRVSHYGATNYRFAVSAGYAAKR